MSTSALSLAPPLVSTPVERPNINAAAREVARRASRKLGTRTTFPLSEGQYRVKWSLFDETGNFTHTLVLAVELPLWADRREMGWSALAVIEEATWQVPHRIWTLIGAERKLNRDVAFSLARQRFCDWAQSFDGVLSRSKTCK